MIVLDASAAVELLLGTRIGAQVAARLQADGGPAHAPHLLDVEVASALRRGVAREDLRDLAVVRYPHGPLLARVWELRARMSPYDGVYVALAEQLGAPLVTRDARLGRAGGHGARVEILGLTTGQAK